MHSYNQTQAKIVAAALDLYLAHGIKKTTIEDVSEKCGLTRATVYRYFKDKKDLVRSSFMLMVDLTQEAIADLHQNKNYDTRQSTDRVRQAINQLPKGDMPARVNELKSLYPDIFTEYRDSRLSSIREIYKHVFDKARQEGLLDPSEVNWDLMPAILSEATLFITESPLVLSHGISFRQIYSAMIDLMLYGVMSKRKDR
jgi:TetR/AcrR family transcriptional regulator, cholesterol catabolism regulator